MADDDESSSNQTAGGGRSLNGDNNEPLPKSWVRSSTESTRSTGWSSSGPKREFTMKDLISKREPRNRKDKKGSDGNGEDEDEDDEDDPDLKREGASWFAGGERSGLSIQNPDRGRVPGGNTVRDILRRAAENSPARDDPRSTSRGGAFSGGGHKLGGDDVESTYIPDPNAPPSDSATAESEPAIRQITFWRDGFSIEDGELLRYDNPENENILTQINTGSAPPQVLNVLPGQPVDLRIRKNLHEYYKPSTQSRNTNAFTGTGTRLGAPIPAAMVTEGSDTMPGAFPSGSGTSGGSGTKFEVNQTLPTTSVQIRLADGTRLVCRMNLTHTVLDLRNFINASRPDNLTRAYVIVTTFPSRTLDDDTATIEGAGLVNSVVLQRLV